MKKLIRNPYIWAFVLGAILVTVIRPFFRYVPAPPPVIAQLPEFNLINQDREPMGSRELSGKVYIANFIFTRCPSICPTLTQNMASLQNRLIKNHIEDIQLVSFSVDPTTDTPEVLKQYGKRFNANTELWNFLTGNPSDIKSLITQGYQLHLGEKEDIEGGLYEMAHASKFALVDQKGNLRGFYDTTESGLDEVYHRAQHVLSDKE
jgi:protein SCO1